MIFRQMFDRESCTFSYLIADERTNQAILVDPVREHVERDLNLIGELGLKLVHIVDTHVHADHVTGAGELRKQTGAKTYISAIGGPPCADVGLHEGDEVSVGRVLLRALATPGHTGGCMSFSVSHEGVLDRVLTGDALFVRGCGRTDFQEGDAGMLFDSVTTRIFSLPDATLVYPAHDYRGMTVSTVGEEKRFNPRLGGAVTRAQFIETMASLKLPVPGRIHEALPANRACGEVVTAG